MHEAILFEGFRSQQKWHVSSKPQTYPQKDKPGQGNRRHRTIPEIKETIQKAQDLSYDIRDIRDELNILKTIVGHQRKVAGDNHRSVQGYPLTTRILNDLENMDRTASRVLSAVRRARFHTIGDLGQLIMNELGQHDPFIRAE